MGNRWNRVRKDVVGAQGCAVALLLALFIGRSPPIPLLDLAVFSAVLLGPVVLLAAYNFRAVTKIMPRTMAVLWYGRVQEGFVDSRDAHRTAKTARWGVRYTQLLAGVMVAIACVLGTHALFERLQPDMFELAVSLVFLPVLHAWVINTVFWRAMERSASVVADAGTATSYSEGDAVFPAWVRVRDALLIAFLMTKSAVKGMLILVIGSTAMGFFMA